MLAIPAPKDSHMDGRKSEQAEQMPQSMAFRAARGRRSIMH